MIGVRPLIRFLAVAGTLALGCDAAASQAEDLFPYQARIIADGVHLLSTPDDYLGPVTGNIVIVEQSDGVILFDSGLTAAYGRAAVGYVRALTPKPIKAVVISHWHNDHPQGVSAVRDAFPNVRIIATAATRQGMLGPEAFDVGYKPDDKIDAAMAKQVSENQARYRELLDKPEVTPDRRARILKAIDAQGRFAADFKGTYIVPPTETFKSRLEFKDPIRPARVLFLGRANTAGDAVLWLPKERIAVSGDMVVWPIPFGFFSFPADWVKSLEKLKALGYSTLIPGHGEPQRDTLYIDQLIGTIEDIRVQVAPLAKQGLTLEEVRKKVDFSRYSELFGTTPRRKQEFAGFWIDPMVENAWKEAKGIAIMQGEGEVQANPAKKSK